MRVIKISILLLLVSILSWCAKQNSDVEKASPKVDLFAKEQQCLSYKDSILNDLKDIQKKSWSWTYLLEQIFYSPSRNKCFFVRIVEYWVDWNYYDRWLYEYGNHSYYSDAEYVCSYYYENWKNVDNWCADMDKKIKTLKQ